MNTSDELVKQTSGALTEAYRDLVQPTARPIGAIASLLPRTVRLWFGKWERWVINGEESLEKTAKAIQGKIEGTPEERLSEPDPYVALPAIQQISYCYDSAELRDLYANLLATSMDSAVKNQVHPSYVELIKQLCPDEAKLLASLPHDTVTLLPVIDLVIEYGGGKGFRTILRNYSQVGCGVCQCADRAPSYLDNLCRLKLIEIPEDLHLVDEDNYKPLTESATIQQLEADTVLPAGATFETKKKVIYVTSFGLGFIQCCVDDYALKRQT